MLSVTSTKHFLFILYQFLMKNKQLFFIKIYKLYDFSLILLTILYL